MITVSGSAHHTPRSRFNPFVRLRPPKQKTKTTKDMLGDDVPDPNCTITVYVGTAGQNEKTTVIGFVSEWINAYTFVSRKYLF